MEQTNMVLAAYQNMAAQGMLPKTGKNGDKAADGFQKLLDQKAQASKSDAPVEQKPRTEAASDTEEKVPVQEESALEKVKKLAEQGYAVVQPNVGTIPFDPNNMTLGQSETGEYVVMQLDEEGEVLSVIELDPWQQQQLQQFVHNIELMDQAKDPEADAMLEATAPGAEISPAELLEKAMDTRTGQVMEEVVEEVQPQEKDEEQVEVVDVDQGAQPIFHDVKAAPVKVGEVYDAQAEEPDVANQIDAQMAQALQRGESMVRIQLNPENLGEVTVEISQSAEGVLKVALTAHNADTRGLLERHASDLQGLLSGRTQQSVEVNVQRQAESQQNQNQQHNYDGRNGHAQDGQERRRRQQEHTSPEDFMQQLRLGLIPDDGGL